MFILKPSQKTEIVSVITDSLLDYLIVGMEKNRDVEGDTHLYLIEIADKLQSSWGASHHWDDLNRLCKSNIPITENRMTMELIDTYEQSRIVEMCAVVGMTDDDLYQIISEMIRLVRDRSVKTVSILTNTTIVYTQKDTDKKSHLMINVKSLDSNGTVMTLTL